MTSRPDGGPGIEGPHYGIYRSPPNLRAGQAEVLEDIPWVSMGSGGHQEEVPCQSCEPIFRAVRCDPFLPTPEAPERTRRCSVSTPWHPYLKESLPLFAARILL